jgi:hypothetical protein
LLDLERGENQLFHREAKFQDCQPRHLAT